MERSPSQISRWDMTLTALPAGVAASALASTSDVEMLRILGVAAIPIVGGLLLSFAFALAQPGMVLSRVSAD